MSKFKNLFYKYKDYKIIFDDILNKLTIKTPKNKYIMDVNTEDIKTFDNIESAEKYINYIIQEQSKPKPLIFALKDKQSIKQGNITSDIDNYYGYVLYNTTHEYYQSNKRGYLPKDIQDPEIIVFTDLKFAQLKKPYTNCDVIKKVLIKNGKINKILEYK